jgi:hypothetical protein
MERMTMFMALILTMENLVGTAMNTMLRLLTAIHSMKKAS